MTTPALTRRTHRLAAPPYRVKQCFKDAALTLALLAFSTSTIGWIAAAVQIETLISEKDQIENLLAVCMSGGGLEERTTKVVYLCDKVVELQPFSKTE